MRDDFLQTTTHPTVAIVGMAKNSGKTTTLNWLLERVVASGRTVGLVSVGVDGEAVDAVTEEDKPAIRLPAGHWMATAASAFSRSEPRFEFVRQLGFSTPMGEAFVASTLAAGDVLLAGMRHRRDVVAARDALVECGADVVFVDGAFGRSAAADGRVAGGVVVSTGAVVGRTPDEIVSATRPLVEQCGLNAPDDEAIVRLGGRAVTSEKLVVRAGGESIELEESTALLGLEAVRDRFGDDLEALALPGAVTDRVVEELVAFPSGPRTLVAASPAAFQTSAEAWATLTDSGWQLRVAHPVSLLGITANPVAPDGGALEGERLVDELAQAFAGTSVINPVETRLAR
jgi:hypothetical protein